MQLLLQSLSHECVIYPYQSEQLDQMYHGHFHNGDAKCTHLKIAETE